MAAGASRAVRSAAALLFLQLVFPDSVPPVVRRLAWVGAVSAGVQGAVSAVPKPQWRTAERRLQEAGDQIAQRLGAQRGLPTKGLRGVQHINAVLLHCRLGGGAESVSPKVSPKVGQLHAEGLHPLRQFLEER